ncbi:MAG: hypothetical protein Q8880_05615 [Bacteroidota bacterium]|nr:hypothetical protein [Bacteroidota bacterium]
MKIIAGVFLSLIYTYYYKERYYADTFKYFDDSKVMYDAFYTNPMDFLKMFTGFHNDTPHFKIYYNQMNHWLREYESDLYNDSHTIIRLNALLRFISGGYYYVHVIFMCFMSLIGLTAIYRAFQNHFNSKRTLLFVSIFLIPSVVFWTSGVLKEGLLIFGLGLLIYNYFNCLNKVRIVNLLMIIFSFIILLFTKAYIVASLVPCLIAYTIVNKTGNKYIKTKYMLVLLFFSIAGISLKYIMPKYDIVFLLYLKQSDFFGLASSVNSGSLISLRHMDNNLISLLLTIPQGLFNVIFHPFIWESKSFLIFFASIENLIIICIVCWCIYKLKIEEENKNMILFFCSFIFFNLVLIGITTPVTGAIVRYKVPILPFIMLLSFLLLNMKNSIANSD